MMEAKEETILRLKDKVCRCGKPTEHEYGEDIPCCITCLKKLNKIERKIKKGWAKIDKISSLTLEVGLNGS